MTALLVAIVALAVTALAERQHQRRVGRVARLAFGPSGRPAEWAVAAPFLRCASVTALAWGATTLALYDPVQTYQKPAQAGSKHLLILLDVSPSMTLEDAGPSAEKVTRAVWAGKLAQAILDRLDTENTRVTLVAFYTKGLPIVQETFDKAVVANALDGLPMYVAFESGATNMHKGVTKALELARVWPRKSAALVVISDGDVSANAAPIHVPDSIADAIVIGVGDPFRSSVINGHASRQDSGSLKQLAARLGGMYHDGNQKHLPSKVLDKLTVISPRAFAGVGLREAALIAVGAGGAVLALLQPSLILFGLPRSFRRGRAKVTRRAKGRDSAESNERRAGALEVAR